MLIGNRKHFYSFFKEQLRLRVTGAQFWWALGFVTTFYGYTFDIF